MNDDPLAWKIAELRGQLRSLGSAVRHLSKSGLDSATAQLLSCKRNRAGHEELKQTPAENLWRKIMSSDVPYLLGA